MQSNFHIPEIVGKYEQRTEDALNVLGAHMVGMVEPEHSISSNLKCSITYATVTEQPQPPKKKQLGEPLKAPGKKLTLKVGTTVEYAAMVEFGGTLKPNTAKALTIPISDNAKGKKATDFDDLFIIKEGDGQAFLVRKVGDKAIEIMFMLVKSVNLSAHPFLRPLLSYKEDFKKFLIQHIKNND